MKLIVIKIVLFLALCIPCTSVYAVNDAATGGQSGVDEAQLQKLQGKMMSDPQIVAMITALQNDPELMALMNDTAFLQAVSNRDINKLSNDPRFVKLMNNPAIRDILKRVEQ